MFFLSIAVFLLIAGFLDASDECSSSHIGICNDASLPQEFPGTAEEFKVLCNAVIPYYECTNNYLGRCAPGTDLRQYIQEAIPIMRDICEKDTPIRKAIVNSLSCLKPKVRDIIGCALWPHDPSFNEENYVNLILAQGIESVSDEENKYQCLGPLFLVACAATRIGQFCGDTAKATLIEITQRFGVVLKYCNPEIVKKLPAIVYALEREKGKQKERYENNVFVLKSAFGTHMRIWK